MIDLYIKLDGSDDFCVVLMIFAAFKTEFYDNGY